MRADSGLFLVAFVQQSSCGYGCQRKVRPSNHCRRRREENQNLRIERHDVNERSAALPAAAIYGMEATCSFPLSMVIGSCCGWGQRRSVRWHASGLERPGFSTMTFDFPQTLSRQKPEPLTSSPTHHDI